MGIYDPINEPTKKSAVEAISKDHGFPLDISVFVHDLAPTHGEAEVVKIIKDAMPARYLKARKEGLHPFLTF
jgi:hypothetical protein